jgi:hypothetical protein
MFEIIYRFMFGSKYPNISDKWSLSNGTFVTILDISENCVRYITTHGIVNNVNVVHFINMEYKLLN